MYIVRENVNIAVLLYVYSCMAMIVYSCIYLRLPFKWSGTTWWNLQWSVISIHCISCKFFQVTVGLN